MQRLDVICFQSNKASFIEKTYAERLAQRQDLAEERMRKVMLNLLTILNSSINFSSCFPIHAMHGHASGFYALGKKQHKKTKIH
jgi:hypothetical protein